MSGYIKDFNDKDNELTYNVYMMISYQKSIKAFGIKLKI